MNLLTGGEMIAFYESCKDCMQATKVNWTSFSGKPMIGSPLLHCFDAWLWCQSFYLATKYLGVSGTNFSARGVQRVCISINGGITYYSVLMVAIMAFY